MKMNTPSIRHRLAHALLFAVGLPGMLLAGPGQKTSVEELLADAQRIEAFSSASNALLRLHKAKPDYPAPSDRARLTLAIARFALKTGDRQGAFSAWQDVAGTAGIPSTLRVEAFLGMAGAESFPMPVMQHCTAALALPDLTPDDRAGILLALARSRRESNFYDMAMALYQQVTSLEGIGVDPRIAALQGLGLTARELRRGPEALKAFEAIIALPEASRAQAAQAYVELIDTHLFPMQYDWTPDDEALEAALKAYDRCKTLPEMKTGLRYAALTRISASQKQAARHEAAIATAQEILKLKRLGSAEIARTHELIGDGYHVLKNYKKAVAHYEHALPADKYRILNKLATAARLDKNYTRAMEAYSDLVPMIDKVEAKDDYNRVTRLLVAMTRATRKMMKTPPAEEVFRSGDDRSLGELTLDDDL
jgi:tetratricopeptide (TPR) repeat protein